MGKMIERTNAEALTLERILSLLPKKEDGSFVRGAKKDFALSIGYDSGDIVSMWINQSSNSYMGKLHEIAHEYNVSLEWLKGESEQKENPTVSGEVDLDDPYLMQLIEIAKQADEAGKKFLIATAKSYIESREEK